MSLPPAIVILLALSALAGASTLWASLARRFLRVQTAADEVHFPRTPDGWRLPLWRFRPAVPKWSIPVVLCHGLQANRFNMHLDEELSLARFLTRRGHDVFVVELRGSGLSRSENGAGHGGFDAHVRQDAPALLRRVQEITGSQQVFWVGHSMGGMLGYALAGGEESARLAGVVAVGSPVTWKHHHPRLRFLGRLLRPRLWWSVPMSAPTRWLAPLAGWVHPPGSAQVINPRNIEGRVIRRALYNLVGDLPRDQLAGFLGWLEHDTFDAADGRADYRARLGDVRTPMLFLAGSQDRLAPPAAVREAFDRLGAEDKTFVVLGPEEGCVEHYGHGDLILGRRAPTEVYPRVAEWLEARMP